jgi:hypothetical protein
MVVHHHAVHGIRHQQCLGVAGVFAAEVTAVLTSDREVKDPLIQKLDLRQKMASNPTNDFDTWRAHADPYLVMPDEVAKRLYDREIDDSVSNEHEAKSPTHLADELIRADSVKLKFSDEVYPLTAAEVCWIVAGLRGIQQ